MKSPSIIYAPFPLRPDSNHTQGPRSSLVFGFSDGYPYRCGLSLSDGGLLLGYHAKNEQWHRRDLNLFVT